MNKFINNFGKYHANKFLAIICLIFISKTLTMNKLEFEDKTLREIISSNPNAAIFAAIETKNSDLAEKVINSPGFDINKPEEKTGKVPLVKAIEKGSPEITKILINKGASINLIQKIHGPYYIAEWNPLFSVVANSNKYKTINNGQLLSIKLLTQNYPESLKENCFCDKLTKISNKEIEKLLKIGFEYYQTINNKENDTDSKKSKAILKLINSKAKDKTSYAFLVKLCFGHSINLIRGENYNIQNPIKRGKRISYTPFYPVYEKLKKAKFLNKIFKTPERYNKENTNIYDFIKYVMENDCFGPLTNRMKASLSKHVLNENMLSEKSEKLNDCKIIYN